MPPRSRRPTDGLLLALAIAGGVVLSAPGPTARPPISSPSYRASQADLSRTDPLYLSVTIFSTVGFGDISATSQSARLAVTSQMILDLLVLGIGINAFVHAARVGRERQSATGEGGPTSD